MIETISVHAKSIKFIKSNRYAKVKYGQGFKFCPFINVKSFDFTKLNKTRWKHIGNQKKKYNSQYMVFDIETSTIKSDTPYSFMYIWMACVEGHVIYGNTWKEFTDLLNRLADIYHLNEDDSNPMVIYCHNLSFEFQFMKNFLNITDVFALSKRKILKVQLEGFEFRCSYMLSNMSLAKFIENTPGNKYLKADGDLDYSIIRTPKTKLSMSEMGYMFNDVKGLYKSIEYLLLNDSLETIPLTNTGFVRRDCRNAMRKNEKNRKNFLKTQLDEHLYKLCKDVFRGGNTASNRYHTNQVIKNVKSVDLSSAYIHEMLSKEFPMGRFMKATIDNDSDLNYYNSKYMTIARYCFKNVKLFDNIPIPYLPFSKCTKVLKPLHYNGRILEAEYIEIAMTNIDFEIVKQQYDLSGGVHIKEFYFSEKGKLPAELRLEIKRFYKEKTEYKDVDGKEYEYMNAKGRCNSTYGMMVTSIIHNKFIMNENREIIQSESVDIDKQISKYYKSRNSFLSYQWGIFVTAYTRLTLQKLIDDIGMQVVYCDTDSVKYTDLFSEFDETIEKHNARILEESGGYYETNPKGRKIYIGIWEKEPEYLTFKTLGAKKYAYTTPETDPDEPDPIKYCITVSGINKEKGAETLKKKKNLDNFKIGTTFVDATRQAWYNESDVKVIHVNGEEITTASNVAILESDYTLGITDDMLTILEEIGKE